jgi:hypothetical protein
VTADRGSDGIWEKDGQKANLEISSTAQRRRERTEEIVPAAVAGGRLQPHHQQHERDPSVSGVRRASSRSLCSPRYAVDRLASAPVLLRERTPRQRTRAARLDAGPLRQPSTNRGSRWTLSSMRRPASTRRRAGHAALADEVPAFRRPVSLTSSSTTAPSERSARPQRRLRPFHNMHEWWCEGGSC